MKRSARGRALVWAAGGVLIFTVACDRASETPVKAPAPHVAVAQVTQETIPVVLTFSGTLQAIKSVDIVPRVGGYVEERYFVEGTRVSKGDPLYLIDPRTYEATLEGYKAQLERDQADHTYWKEQVKRNTKLQKSGAASVEDVENAVAREKEALAAIANDKANIQKAELDLEFTRVNAPFDGRIQNTRINVGALVTAHQDVLTTLVQIDPIYAVFSISRRQLDEIQQLMAEGIVTPGPLDQFEVDVLLPDGNPYPNRGRMNFVSAQIDPSTDQMLARAEFPNVYDHPSDVRLIPGQYAPVRVYIGQRTDALLIPKAARVESQAGDLVYVVGADDKVEARHIQVSGSHDRFWVVAKGLEKAERVVVEGLQKVRDGIVVVPQAAKNDEKSASAEPSESSGKALPAAS